MDTTSTRTDPPDGLPPLSGSYYIRTKQYETFAAHAREHFAVGRPALLVTGDHSVGAAEACRRFSRQRGRERGAVLVALSTAPPLQANSRNAFLAPAQRTCAVVMRELLGSWGGRLAHTQLQAIPERVVRKLRVDSHDFSGRINCFVDLRTPGELSDIVHLEYLRNQLQRHGCSMETIALYSRLEPAQIHALGSSPAAKPVAARWLSNSFQWRCLPVAELPDFLKAYDKPSKSDGVSRSERYAPEWWRSGWRMGASAKSFTDALHEVSKSAGKGRCTEVPTGTLARICESVLSSSSLGRAPDAQIQRSVLTSDLKLYWSLHR